MRKQFAKGIYLLAFAGALESQVHKDVLQNPVLLVERINLVADGTLELAIRDTFTWDFGKT